MKSISYPLNRRNVQTKIIEDCWKIRCNLYIIQQQIDVKKYVNFLFKNNVGIGKKGSTLFRKDTINGLIKVLHFHVFSIKRVTGIN